MNTRLKTLLTVSAITLSLSACAGNMHGKNSMQCKVSKHLMQAQRDADNLSKNLQGAVDSVKDAATKKRLQKIVMDADKVSKSIGQCKKMCDAKKMEGKKAEGKKSPAKSGHKGHHATKAAPAGQDQKEAPKTAK